MKAIIRWNNGCKGNKVKTNFAINTTKTWNITIGGDSKTVINVFVRNIRNFWYRCCMIHCNNIYVRGTYLK